MAREDSARLVLEVAIDGIGTQGFALAMEEYELDLWELLQEQIRPEISVGIGVLESDNGWMIAGHSGLIVGARLDPGTPGTPGGEEKDRG